jgi:hypothetical protein
VGSGCVEETGRPAKWARVSQRDTDNGIANTARDDVPPTPFIGTVRAERRLQAPYLRATMRAISAIEAGRSRLARQTPRRRHHPTNEHLPPRAMIANTSAPHRRTPYRRLPVCTERAGGVRVSPAPRLRSVHAEHALALLTGLRCDIGIRLFAQRLPTPHDTQRTATSAHPGGKGKVGIMRGDGKKKGERAGRRGIAHAIGP